MDIEATLRRLKIDDLNAMQREVVVAMFRTEGDIVVLSPTGSGKTLAYLLPLAQQISAAEALTAVVIVPSRELARQSEQVMSTMGCHLRSTALHGGRPTMDEHRLLRQTKPQIVFATPGRLNDHIDKGNIDVATVRWLVIDEFDKCLAMGFREEMTRAVQRMTALRRRVLLSATEAREIPTFVGSRQVTRVDYLPADRQAPERVSISLVRSPQKDKLDTVERLLLTLGEQSTIVFVNYRDSVERVNTHLRRRGYTTSMLHGGMDQRQREDNLYRFSNGSANILVSTDLASRGLDIPDVDNIVHCHMPTDHDSYIHRTGRTARWDKTGQTFFVLAPDESLPEYVTSPVSTITLPAPPTHAAVPQPRMATVYIGKGKKDKISRGDILGFLCKQASLPGSRIGRIDVRERYSYAAVERDALPQVLAASPAKVKGVKTVVEEVR